MSTCKICNVFSGVTLGPYIYLFMQGFSDNVENKVEMIAGYMCLLLFFGTL